MQHHSLLLVLLIAAISVLGYVQRVAIRDVQEDALPGHSLGVLCDNEEHLPVAGALLPHFLSKIKRTLLTGVDLLLPGLFSLIYTSKFSDQPRYRRLELPTGTRGPESLAFDDKQSGPYTGVSDGRIIKWDSRKQGWIDFSVPSTKRPQTCNGSQDPLNEDICGRPLGLEFNPADGHLYIADSAYGLLKVGPRGGFATLLANSAGGVDLTFTNAVVINQDDGMIYFTDSSTKFKRRDYVQVVTTRDSSGRLLRYDPRNNVVEILMCDLMFPNGLALSKDNRFLLMAETTTGKITRYWLKGDKAGENEEFARVPRYPDNIRRNSRGAFWVAIEQSPMKVSDVSTTKYSRFQNPDPTSIVKGILLDEEGAVVEVLGDDGGKLTSLSEIHEKNDTLWIGSVEVPYVSIYAHEA